MGDRRAPEALAELEAAALAYAAKGTVRVLGVSIRGPDDAIMLLAGMHSANVHAFLDYLRDASPTVVLAMCEAAREVEELRGVPRPEELPDDPEQLKGIIRHLDVEIFGAMADLTREREARERAEATVRELRGRVSAELKARREAEAHLGWFLRVAESGCECSDPRDGHCCYSCLASPCGCACHGGTASGERGRR